jgi:DinB superfamily
MSDDAAEPGQAQLERVRTLSTRMSSEELARPVDDVWTAAGLLAHIAFWDRFCRARWLHAQRTGRRTPAHIEDDFTEMVNEANIPLWNAVPPRAAIQECLEAGAAVDELIRSLDSGVVADVIVEGRQRLVDRSIHRSEHLDLIARAFSPD